MPFFTTHDGCRIYFEDKDAGAPARPAVVFLNGTSQTAVNWTAIANSLQGDFRTLAYDARAQGRSDMGALAPSLTAHCMDLHDLLEHREIRRAHLVGLSHGAHVALAFAARYPRAADRLILCSIGAKPSCRAVLARRTWLEIVANQGVEAMARAALPLVFGEKFLYRNRTMLEKIVQAIAMRNRKENLIAHLEAMAGDDMPARIAPSVHGPVLVLSGADDPMVQAEGARELAQLCSGRHILLPDAGHSLPSEVPEVFTAMVRNFLQLTT